MNQLLTHPRRLLHDYRPGMPPRIAWFHVRAREMARERHDDWALRSATYADPLVTLLRLARGAANVVELGTGVGWTTGALALADKNRRVTSYDIREHDNLHDYLGLLPPSARARITLVRQSGSVGPPSDDPVDFLFIDSSHNREQTLAEFRAWEPVITPGGTIAFHDWENPDYPGVTEAIRELGLHGDATDGIFTWTKP